jgi:hypothetical protein
MACGDSSWQSGQSDICHSQLGCWVDQAEVYLRQNQFACNAELDSVQYEGGGFHYEQQQQHFLWQDRNQ